MVNRRGASSSLSVSGLYHFTIVPSWSPKGLVRATRISVPFLGNGVAALPLPTAPGRQKAMPRLHQLFQVLRMHRLLPTPASSLFLRESSLFEPVFVQKLGRAVCENTNQRRDCIDHVRTGASDSSSDFNRMSNPLVATASRSRHRIHHSITNQGHARYQCVLSGTAIRGA